MPGCTRPVGYVPRQTHECDAAVLVRRHLAEFLERCEERAGPLPAFVKGELEGFAGCGDFELGFVRTCCRSCGEGGPHDRLAVRLSAWVGFLRCSTRPRVGWVR
jgi:hypothetical protein